MQDIPGIALEWYPVALRCELSGVVLTDPVIDLTSGKSYDRSSFCEKYPNRAFAKNIALKNIADEWPKIEKYLEKKETNEFHDFLCCISQAIYREPLLVPSSGFSYEGSEIQEWLKKHRNDPICKQPIAENEKLICNVNLKELIKECISRYPAFGQITADGTEAFDSRLSEEARREKIIAVMREKLKMQRRFFNFNESLRNDQGRVYSQSMELFSALHPRGYSKVDLLNKFRSGVERFASCNDDELINTLKKIFDIIKTSTSCDELVASLRGQRGFFISSHFVQTFGMNQEEMIQLFSTRIFAPERSSTHKNVALKINEVERALFCEEFQECLRVALARLRPLSATAESAPLPSL